MAAMKRLHRPKTLLPSCYYEGFLEKRSFKDKTARKFWASLCGNAVFFYNHSKDNNYVEKLDLSNFISLTDDTSHDRKLDAARLHLRLKDDEVYLTAPSLEARELWKGFIFSVVKLEVPTSLTLLPGQIHMLREAVEKETERLQELAERAAASQASITVPMPEPENYLSLVSEMPACFHRVSREDAELLLEKNKEKGNLLLRPCRGGGAFAVTTHQEYNGLVFKHYRVTRIPDGQFAIAVDNPIYCNSLHDVVNSLIEKTGGVFKPLILENTYEGSIEYVEDDQENGEKSVRCASSEPVLVDKPPQRPVPALRTKPFAIRTDPDESVYLNPSDEEDHDDEVEIVPPRVLHSAPVKQLSMPELQISSSGALLPPTTRRQTASEFPKAKPRQTLPPVPLAESLSHSLNEELKLKLQLRAQDN